MQSLILSCPKGLEGLLGDEAERLGAQKRGETVGAVTVDATPDVIYRLCLWSRLANRVLLPLAEFPGDSAQQLYDGLYAIDWPAHMREGSSLLVDFAGRSREIRIFRDAGLSLRCSSQSATVSSLHWAGGMSPTWRAHCRSVVRIAAALEPASSPVLVRCRR